METPPSAPIHSQKHEPSEDCKELLESLPRKSGWNGYELYQYEGFWYPAKHLQGVFACRNHFRARDTDTILVTTPKSGTTWLKAMAFALLNRSARLDQLLTESPPNLVPFLELLLDGRGELPDPRIFATHAPAGILLGSYANVGDSSCKIVYMCRDPKDVFVSFWHFSGKLSPMKRDTHELLKEMFDQFCDGASPYGPHWDHVLGYWNESLKNPHKVLFLRYEEVLEKPAAHLRRIAEFLGCPFSPEEEAKGTVDEISRLCSFDNLSNLEVNKTGTALQSGLPTHSFFRKGKSGGYAEVLTPEMIERLDHITREKMSNSGFKF